MSAAVAKMPEAKKEKAGKDYVARTQLAMFELKGRIATLVKDPTFQTHTIMTGGGAVTFGAVGGAFGTMSGIVVGGAAGVVPALLTFGLSVPVGAAMGGGAGFCAGTMIGGGTGGLAGFQTFKYRVEIKRGIVIVKMKTAEALTNTQKAIKTYVAAGKTRTATTLRAIADTTKVKSSNAFQIATTTKSGVTASSAAAGSLAGGVAGGATGLMAGAAVGVVPAIFTLGLSIPVFATVGLCAGTATGGTAGAVTGGAVGNVAFAYRKEIAAKSKPLMDKASGKAASMSKSLQALVRGSTGGTI